MLARYLRDRFVVPCWTCPGKTKIHSWVESLGEHTDRRCNLVPRYRHSPPHIFPRAHPRRRFADSVGRACARGSLPPNVVKRLESKRRNTFAFPPFSTQPWKRDFPPRVDGRSGGTWSVFIPSRVSFLSKHYWLPGRRFPSTNLPKPRGGAEPRRSTRAAAFPAGLPRPPLEQNTPLPQRVGFGILSCTVNETVGCVHASIP